MQNRRTPLLLTALLFFVAPVPQSQATTVAPPPQWTVAYDPSIAQTFTGRVYLMFNAGIQEPRFGPAWFGTQPFYALDVADWKPGVPLVFDDSAVGFPGKLSEIDHGEYTVQALMRINFDSPNLGRAQGNAFSKAVRVTVGEDQGENVSLRIATRASERPFRETDRIKLIEHRSDMLSAFHGREVVMRAGVLLPSGYEENPDRRYPALYWIGGFGSDHRSAAAMARQSAATGFDDQIVRVVLDPSCYGGHHVFADSANNGPRGAALVREFIPHLERSLRLASSPHGRFLSGHSSGGWSSLWLQITYPDFFGGTWSIAPDPVDFRDFQRIDLYRPGANMYIDEEGKRRPIARQGDRILGWYEPFAKMEVVLGEGGQLRSFEWVFSKRGSDGLPEPLYDRQTGMIDNQIAEDWKRYDIRLILEENWAELGPKLENGAKLRIFMGELDTFYLEGATRLLKQSQAELGSDAVIEIQEGKDHGTIASPGLRRRIDQELMDVFLSRHRNMQPQAQPKPALQPAPAGAD